MTAINPGVKNFAHLEILEADDINDYLMSQAIPRFATEVERDAQMPVPVEGQHCYVSTVGAMWFDGGAWALFEGPQGEPGEPGTPSPVNSVAGRDGDVVLTSADVGLGNVDNTSDAGKPVSTAQQAALDLKAPLASPTFTGTVTGVSKTAVGLSNVDNTSDAGKPVSTAQAAADALKVSKTGDTMTGTLIAPGWPLGVQIGTGLIAFDTPTTFYFRNAANSAYYSIDCLNVTCRGALDVTRNTAGLPAFQATATNATGDAIWVLLAAGSTGQLYLRGRVAGDGANRIQINGTGEILWGSGAATGDTNLKRSAADVLGTDDDFAILTAGKGLRVKEGTNAKMGTVVLVAGAGTVSTTAVTANSRIFLTSQVDGGTPGWLRVNNRSAGSWFTIASSSATDTSTVAWHIIEPA